MRQRTQCTRLCFSTVVAALLVVSPRARGQYAESVVSRSEAEPMTKGLPRLDVPFDLSLYTKNPNAAQAHANNAVVYGDWTGPPLHDGIPEGFKVVDGDIVVPEGFGRDNVASTFTTELWLAGVVPYEFDSNVSQDNANAMGAAMSWWESVAAVDFRPRDGELFFIHIRADNSNNSLVGTHLFGQVVNIFNWNMPAIMAHELGHVLGYWHEQARADRDNYVTILGGNICQNCCSGDPCDFQFQIQDDALNYGPYDFDSVMHYGRCDFSANRPGCIATCPSPVGETISVKAAFNAVWQCGSPTIPDPTPDGQYIGQRTHLSFWDSQVMSFLYPQWNWRFQAGGGDDKGPGTFIDPYGTFREGWEDTPPGGILWVLYPSQHGVDWTLDKPMTIVAPLGGVVLAR